MRYRSENTVWKRWQRAEDLLAGAGSSRFALIVTVLGCRTLKAKALFLGIVGAFAGSCGGKAERQSVEVPETGPIDEDIFAEALAQGICSLAEECSCFTGVTSYNDCFDELTGRARSFALEDIVYDKDRARVCIDALADSACEGSTWDDVCWSVYHGSIEPGGSCTFDVQCRGNETDQAYCVFDECLAVVATGPGELGSACSTNCGQGTCEQLPTSSPVNYGECHQEDGLRCANEVCVPLLSEGDACDNVHDCEIGLYCKEGLCAPQLELGETCRIDSDLSCGGGSFCSWNQNNDLACIRPRQLDRYCEEDRGCASGNCSNQRCKEDDTLQPVCGEL